MESVGLAALDQDCLRLLAQQLLDVRDITSLRATCRLLNDFYSDEELWHALLHARFGPERGPRLHETAQEAFVRLSKLQLPVTEANVTWLNGQYLEEVDAPGSVAGRTVRVNAVCWLHVSGVIPGALPGRYEARCRLKLLPQWHTDELNISAQVLPSPHPGAAPAAAAEGQELPGASRSRSEVVSDEDGGDAGQAGQDAGEAGQAAAEPEAAVAAAHRCYAWQQLRHELPPAGTWCEIATPPFTLVGPGPCTVEMTVHAHSGNWKRGILFDTLRLLQLDGPGSGRAQQAQQVGQQLVRAGEAGAGAAGPSGSGSVRDGVVAAAAAAEALGRRVREEVSQACHTQ